jgi:hypothetical protein
MRPKRSGNAELDPRIPASAAAMQCPDACIRDVITNE